MKNLPAHSKFVLCSVYLLNRNIRQIVTGEIYEVYCELCEQLGVTPLTQRRVSGLINELDSIGLLNTQLINMGRYGRTKKIRLGITQNQLRTMFADDSRLEHLSHYSLKRLTEFTR